MAQAAIITKCDFCDSDQDVSYFCTNCEELLCSKCKVGHAKSKKTKNDRIIPLAQAREDGIVHKSVAVFCNEHPSVEVTLFCLMCNQLVCTQCLAGQHMKHQVTIPDEVKESKTQELRNNIKILKEKKAVFENAFDIEGKAHIEFSKSIDQVRKDITDQKAKLIEELNLLCKEQFSELTILQQNEDKRYSDACSKIRVQNQAVTMAIQTAETRITSSNTSVIIQATVDTTQTLRGLEEPDIPPTTVATYEQGDKTRSSILHFQGKIKIRQTETVVDLPGIRSQQSDINAQENFNTEMGAKPKQTTDAHKVNLQEQNTSGDNKQQQGKVANKPRIDLSKVRVKYTIKAKDQYSIHVIVPLQNKTAWVQADSNPYLTLINKQGKVIAKSVPMPNVICDAKKYRNELVVTCWRHSKVHILSLDGKSTSTFCDLSPYNAVGVCAANDMSIIVCLVKPYSDKKVVRLNTSGNIIQTLQHYEIGETPLNDLYCVTSLTTGEVIVSDKNKIVGVDRDGRPLFIWEGEVQGKKFHDYTVSRITHDSNNKVFVTDCVNHRVFVLDEDGCGAICLSYSTHGIDSPRGVAVDNAGHLWVGCKSGNIRIIEYFITQ